ncbi:hypothetical protein Y032_0312g2173 [Ancylostoma ceylanicum]|uniref:Uncharacterized protein n=1 Tax=Ancylostoma ceylanicum TaxID=53326 RepID=A0A016S340_9BILA|nr:hypothetical protein Y032_0312g2173 [Ancylostoma ceylanicum]
MSTVSPPEPFVSTSVPGQPTEPDDGRIEPSEKMFGIARRPVAQLSQEDIDCLYRELRVTKESHNVRVVFVKGTDDMTRFAVEKIFAEYHPCRVEIVDKSSCLVSFASRADCVREFEIEKALMHFFPSGSTVLASIVGSFKFSIYSNYSIFESKNIRLRINGKIECSTIRDQFSAI